MKPIFLIGLPGCGKSTLGRALARRLGISFYDIDNYIESRFRKSVSEIFTSEGEAEFRRKESMMLREIGEMQDVVIACGGGTPCHNDNLHFMNTRGITVWLQASEPVVLRRLIRAKTRRPMFATCADEGEILLRLRRLTEERSPLYAPAHYRFDADDLENKKMIDSSVDRFLMQITPFQNL